MTEPDVRVPIGTAPLPQPRPAADDAVAPVGARRVRPLPWPEPCSFTRATRPRTEYWDVATAGWRSRGPVAGSGTDG